MTNYYIITGIIISLGLSMLLLYTRKKKWFPLKSKYFLTTLLMVTSIIGFVLSNKNNARFLFYSLLIPFICLLTDRLFKYLSLKLHDRDFILYLEYADGIDNKLTKSKNHVKKSDIMFSFSLLLLISGLLLLGIELFGKDNLYYEWFVR